MKKPVVLGLVIAALVAVIAGGTWWYQSRQDNGLTLYGNVDIRSVNLSFRVGGRLASLAVDEGDAITAGQVLGELDRAPYENALMQAKANRCRRTGTIRSDAGRVSRRRDRANRGGSQTGAGRL